MKKFFLAIIVLALTACEKAVIDSSTESAAAEANVILHLRQYEQEAFTREASDITEICSRLSVAVFANDGSKVKTVAQKEGDSSYGTVALTLAAGTYKLVVIAHNGDGAATISATDRVTFPNNKVTDTFYYYGTLEATDAKQNYDLELLRAVAMFRIQLADETIPANVARMKFYYLGGSSTFSPEAGYGCVQSKQTEYRIVDANTKTFELYTLPHCEEDVLTRLTITALDAADNIIQEQTLENIPVTRNRITRYSGSLFGGGNNDAPSSGLLRLTADPAWDGEQDYTR